MPKLARASGPDETIMAVGGLRGRHHWFDIGLCACSRLQRINTNSTLHSLQWKRRSSWGEVSRPISGRLFVASR